MSDAIGNGGGGGNFNILDPLGLGGIVQGLVSGLVGEAGKALKGPDMGCIAQVGQQLLNKVGSFEQAGGTQSGAGQDAGQSGPVTEFSSPKDPAVAEAGYKPIADQGEPKDTGTDDPSQNVGQGGSNTQGGSTQDVGGSKTDETQQQVDPAQRGQSSFAATGVHDSSSVLDAQNEAELKALTPLLAYANAIDHYGVAGDVNDGLFNRDSLRNVANDPGLPSELRDAAQYILDHPKMMQTLQINTGRGDGSISNSAVSGYASKLMHGASAGAGAGAGAGGNVGIHTVQQSKPSGSGPVAQNSHTGPSGQTSATGNAPPPSGQSTSTSTPSQPKTIDEKLGQMGAGLEAMQDQLIALYNKDPGTLTDKEKVLVQTLPLEIQKATHRYQQMYDLVSNLMKAFNDMSMNAIRHIA